MAKNGFSMSNRVATEKITGDKTLTNDDCGKVFIVDSVTQGSAVDITMPAKSATDDGWHVRLICESGSGGGADAQNVVLSGSAQDTPVAIMFRLNTLVSGDDAQQKEAGTITLAGTTLANNDEFEIMLVNGNLLGKYWSVNSFTSGALTVA